MYRLLIVLAIFLGFLFAYPVVSAKHYDSNFILWVIFLSGTVIIPLVLVMFVHRQTNYSANLFYILSILVLLLVPVQQFVFGLVSFGTGGYNYNPTTPFEIWGSLAITIFLMFCLIILAFRLFQAGESNKHSLVNSVLSIVNVVLGIIITFGYLAWHLQRIFTKLS